MRAIPCRYPLQFALDRQEWGVDTLTLELASARKALREHEDEVTRRRHLVDQLNASLVAMRAGGATLDLTRQQVLLDFRVVQEESVAEAQARLVAAHDLCDQIADQLARARTSLKTFENHKTKLRGEHEREMVRVEAREADEAWLLRCGFRGAER